MQQIRTLCRMCAFLLCAFILVILQGCDRAKANSKGAGENPAKSQGSAGGAGGGGQRKFPVRTTVVTTQKISYDIEAVGRLVEENEFRIPARVAGTAENVNFREGDAVTSGQELCRVDFDRYRLMVDKARKAVEEKDAGIVRAQAMLLNTQRETSSTLETARLDFELAEADYKRRAQLKQGAYVSEEERQQFESKYKRSAALYRSALGASQTETALSAAAVEEARTAFDSAKVTLSIAEDDLGNAIIRAPISGVVQQRSVTNGQYLAPGTTVALMVQTDPLRLRFTVPESKTARLSKDMSIKFSVPAYPRRDFEAKVYEVSSIADPATNEVQCWAMVNNAEGTLRPGYFAKVAVNVDTRDEAIVVPLGGVMPTEAGMVAYVIKDEIAQQRQVQTGLQVTGDAIEIVSGLRPGEQLVVEGNEALQDGFPVRVVGSRSGNQLAVSDRNTSEGTRSLAQELAPPMELPTTSSQTGKETASK